MFRRMGPTLGLVGVCLLSLVTSGETEASVKISQWRAISRCGNASLSDDRPLSPTVPNKLRLFELTFFFWIESSALRAFGECLGSKRR